MTREDVSVEVAAHNTDLLDVIITCPKCGLQLNDFIDTTEIMVMEASTSQPQDEGGEE